MTTQANRTDGSVSRTIEPTRTQLIFLTGATGALGLAATEALRGAGHLVTGVARSPEGTRALEDRGAVAVRAGLDDVEGLTQAMAGADVVMHFATRIPGGFSATRRRAWRENDHLRLVGTAALIAAAESAGVRRFILESYALAYDDHGAAWIEESEPLRPVWSIMDSLVGAEVLLAEFAARGGEAISLRFGRLYGRGRASDELTGMIRRRQIPIVGSGDNYITSLHVEDAGAAVSAALSVRPGTYNVVDDEPISMTAYMEAWAEAAGAPRPRRMPYALARLLLGRMAKVATASQRVSNRRFREASGWAPRYASALKGWPDVFREVDSR